MIVSSLSLSGSWGRYFYCRCYCKPAGSWIGVPPPPLLLSCSSSPFATVCSHKLHNEARDRTAFALTNRACFALQSNVFSVSKLLKPFPGIRRGSWWNRYAVEWQRHTPRRPGGSWMEGEARTWCCCRHEIKFWHCPSCLWRLVFTEKWEVFGSHSFSQAGSPVLRSIVRMPKWSPEGGVNERAILISLQWSNIGSHTTFLRWAEDLGMCCGPGRIHLKSPDCLSRSQGVGGTFSLFLGQARPEVGAALWSHVRVVVLVIVGDAICMSAVCAPHWELVCSYKFTQGLVLCFQLGCGVGIPGLYAYNQGAEVHFQDYVSKWLSQQTMSSSGGHHSPRGISWLGAGIFLSSASFWENVRQLFVHFLPF